MMTTTVKQVGSIKLIKGHLQAEGLYRFYDVATEDVSFWFDTHEAEIIISLPDNEFLEEAHSSIDEANSYNK